MNEMRDLPLFLWPPSDAGAGRVVQKTLFSLLGGRWLSVGVSKFSAAWPGVHQIEQSLTPAIDQLRQVIDRSFNRLTVLTTKIKRSITVSYTATDRNHARDQSRDRSHLVTQSTANSPPTVTEINRFDHSQSDVATDYNDSVNYWSDNKIN